jgi:hypothetical protein
MQPDITVIDHDAHRVIIIEWAVTTWRDLTARSKIKHEQYADLEKAINSGKKYTCKRITIVVGATAIIPRAALEALSTAFPIIPPPTIVLLLKSIARGLAKDAIRLRALDWRATSNLQL